MISSSIHLCEFGLHTQPDTDRSANLGNFMGYGKYCQCRNCPIWKILWDTGNNVSVGTVQSGKFYGRREILSARELSNLGNFMG